MALKWLIPGKLLRYKFYIMKASYIFPARPFAIASLVLALASGSAQSLTVDNPSSLTDAEFECLKGNPAASCAPAKIEENWVVEGSANFARINEWTSNQSFTPRDPINQSWPLGTDVPFSATYTKATGKVEFSIFNPTQISQATNLTRSPFIDSLYIRTASSGGVNGAITRLTDLTLTQGTTTTDIGDVTSITSGTTREVSYAFVTGIPNEDFTISGIAFVDGSTSGANWQIKASYHVPSSESVPGPLPVLGGAAAFGWSRKLRKRLRVG
jgi:hypothetical protein